MMVIIDTPRGFLVEKLSYSDSAVTVTTATLSLSHLTRIDSLIREIFMPELPEVQSFVNAITQNYVGKNIETILFHRKNLRYKFDQNGLKKIFAPNSKLLKCFRVGKLLFLETENGVVNISLGMTGSFKESNVKNTEKHEHVTILFKDKSALGYIDARRFGYWQVYNESKSYKAVDPLNSQDLFNLFMSDKVKKCSRTIKDILMDQKIIGGIGNIYALEGLFNSKIHPTQVCSKMTDLAWKSLSVSIPAILEKAIICNGSSVATYRTLNGNKGGFQEFHLVYDREGEKCLRANCAATIQRIKQSGRSSWLCPNCQAKK